MELRKINISDIGKIITGKTPRTSITENYGGDIPFLTPSDDLTRKHVVKTGKTLSFKGLNEVKNCLIPEKSICVSCIGSDLGKVVMTNAPTVTNQQINSIIVNDEFDPDFIYYLMKIVGRELNFISKTSTAVPIINKSTFSNTEVFVPSLENQIRIGEILSSLDDKIELNRQINDNLERQLQCLYREWFIENPKADWPAVSLSEIATFTSGYSYKGNELVENSDTAMATIKNFERNGGFKIDGYKPIVPSPKLKSEQRAQLFDILVAHTDLTQNAEVIGNAEILLSKDIYKDLIFSMDLVKVNAKESFPFQFLLALLLKNPRFKSHCIGYVNGTTVLHMNKRALPDYETIIPSEEDAINLNATAKAIFCQMSENLTEILNLIQLRDVLLPKLMSGELKINEIDC